MDKETKFQIIEILKDYKNMDFKLKVLHEKLNTTLDERQEIRILNTIQVITRDKNIIDTALASLKDKHREAFELRFVQGLNADDTAVVMSVNRSTVYMYTNKVIKAIYNEILAVPFVFESNFKDTDF